MLFTDALHSFVCCLSSMNLARWDEWKDTDAVETAIVFLDCVMEEFIIRAAQITGMEKAVRFAEKSRALGLGVLGFHSLIQSKGMAFDSMEAYLLNNVIFKTIRQKADAASERLAKDFGEPEWCKGTRKRNTHLIAVAPTASNSIISGGHSTGIEPITANAYALKSAKGTFMVKNAQLELLLADRGKNTDEVWRSIVSNEGSVQHLDFLSPEEKKLFETAREMNQFVLVKLAAARQKWIDQGQSLNLFFPANVDPKYFNEVHLEAHKSGIKTIYYCRSSSVLKGDSGFKEYKRELEECTFCHG
jgi:ribonucleoside-diphosphate reductase alpha chain